MDIYYSCNRNGGIVYGMYSGLTQDQVTALLTDLQATDIKFIDQATYDVAVAQMQGV
jgi:hypothetical protein